MNIYSSALEMYNIALKEAPTFDFVGKIDLFTEENALIETELFDMQSLKYYAKKNCGMEVSEEEKKEITLCSNQNDARAKIKSELDMLKAMPEDFVQFVDAYLDYKESNNEEPKSEEVDEVLIQMKMLGCTFEELKATVQSLEADENKTEEEWSRVFEKTLPGYSRELMDTFPLVLEKYN